MWSVLGLGVCPWCLPPRSRGRAKRDKTGELLPHVSPPPLRAEAPGKGAEGLGVPAWLRGVGGRLQA